MNLLPRDEKFFQYFQQQVKLICQAARPCSWRAPQRATPIWRTPPIKFNVLEEQADNVLHETYTRLNPTFITPLDPEDIQSLSSHLDDVIDGIEDSVHRVLDYYIDPMSSTVMELCCIVQSCCLILQKALDALAKGEPFIDHSIEINRLEEAADQLGRAAVKELFEQEKDPIRIIKLKEIYEFLEQTTDYCEDVADALQNVQIKNS